MYQLNQRQQTLLELAYKHEEGHKEFLDKNVDLFGADNQQAELVKLVLDTIKRQEDPFETIFPVAAVYVASKDLSTTENEVVLEWVSKNLLH